MKKLTLFVFYLLIIPVVSLGQPMSKIYEYPIVEKKPVYPGGFEALKNFFQKNIKYPPRAIDENKEGKVYIRFVINKDSSVSHPRVMKTFDEDCARQAIRLIKKTKWVPGEHKGKIVKVAMIVPVEFVLPIPEIEDNIEVEEDFIAVPEPKAEIEKDEVFEVVEQMPEYKGGRDSLLVFIAKKIVYPTRALEAGIQGMVFLKFVIEPNGKVSNIRAVKTFDRDCTNEAIRVIKLTSGKWNAGKQRGKKVRVNVVQPIVFKLN